MPARPKRLPLLLLFFSSASGALLPPSQLVASGSASSNGVAADAFDQTPSSFYSTSSSTAWLQANLSDGAWSIDQYSLSAYGLHGSFSQLLPR